MSESAESTPPSERERIAQLAMGLAPSDGWGQTLEWERGAFYDIADALIAAGFGDVAQAWDEGANWAAEGLLDEEFTPETAAFHTEMNPYRKVTS